jgi:Sigma-70 region 2
MSAKLDGEFRDFMHARWPAMVRLAYGLTGDQGHAEDVAQAAFARAYASWPRVRRSGDPATRAVVLDTASALERVPGLLGVGPHLLATGLRPPRGYTG